LSPTAKDKAPKAAKTTKTTKAVQRARSTCTTRALDWGSQLAAEQVRMLTEFIEHGVLLANAAHAMECRACRVAAGDPCRTAT
jgi:hypothetical protein